MSVGNKINAAIMAPSGSGVNHIDETLRGEAERGGPGSDSYKAYRIFRPDTPLQCDRQPAPKPKSLPQIIAEAVKETRGRRDVRDGYKSLVRRHGH
jgi:hypothetical protein